MSKINRTIDINEHITDITCNIVSDAGKSVASIGFENLGFGTVTAVKFSAVGYNAFGDIIKVNNSDSFYLIIQDISIKPNSTASDLKAVLPNTDIRKVTLTESQVIYEGGNVVSYEGESIIGFETEKYDEAGEGAELSSALKDRFGEDFKYKPVEIDGGWVCGCGRYNPNSQSVCSNCKGQKADIFTYTSDEKTQELIDSYKQAQEELKEQNRVQNEAKAKAEKKKKILIAAGSAVLLAISIFIVNAIILSERQTYDSVSAMRAAMQGTWTRSLAYTAGTQIRISGDNAEFDIMDGYDPIVQEIKWYPKRGVFKVFGDKYVVRRGARTIKDGDRIYERGYGSSSSSTSDYSSSYEKGSDVLKIKDVEVTHNSSYTVCTGTVKNTGSKTYTFIEVKGSFKTSSGSVVDTDSTYACSSEGLAPNESTTFYMSVPVNENITSCDVTVYDYN